MPATFWTLSAGPAVATWAVMASLTFMGVILCVLNSTPKPLTAAAVPWTPGHVGLKAETPPPWREQIGSDGLKLNLREQAGGLGADQAEEGGDEADVDLVFDVPQAMSGAICGWRPDMDNEDWGEIAFTRLRRIGEPDPPAKRSWLAKLFGG